MTHDFFIWLVWDSSQHYSLTAVKFNMVAVSPRVKVQETLAEATNLLITELWKSYGIICFIQLVES